MPIYDPRVHRVDREKLTERRQSQLIEKANIPVRFDYAVDLIKNSGDGRAARGEGNGAAEGVGGAPDEGKEADQGMLEAADPEASPAGAGRGKLIYLS